MENTEHYALIKMRNRFILGWLLVTLFSCRYADQAAENAKQLTQLIDHDEAANLATQQQQRMYALHDSLYKTLPNWLAAKKYNNVNMLVAHLGVHSGLNRLFLLDLQRKTAVDSGLVAHGSGGPYFAKNAVFSNVPNSYCSSPGKYRIGNRYNGRFGRSFKLHGLDATNNNAFKRAVVLHSYHCVPNQPIYPLYLCNSQGCPMVSEAFLARLAPVIQKSSKPMLLLILP